jgi:hypothetical protein
LDGLTVEGCLLFEAQARSRFSHATTENDAGAKAIDIVRDEIASGGILDREMTQQQDIRGEILAIDRLLDQIIGGVRSLMWQPGIEARDQELRRTGGDGLSADGLVHHAIRHDGWNLLAQNLARILSLILGTE